MLVKLINYVDIISGGTPKTTIKDYWNGNIPWLTIDDFKNVNKCVFTTKKSITIKGLENSNTNILHRNDIIISARGTVGKIALIHNNMAFNQSCFGLRINNKNVLNAEYLFYYLKSNLMHILKASQGAIFNSINLDSFKYIMINVPSIKNQIRVSKILSQIDNQIERNISMINKLQVLGKTIYSKNAKNCNYYKLKNISAIATGKEDANHSTFDGKYRFFTCGDNILFCDDYKFDGKSVLVAGNGNFNVKFYNGKFNAYQRTYIIKNDKIIGNIYYTLFFNTELFRKKSNGSIIKFITIDMLNKIELPILSLKINEILNSILTKINKIEEKSSYLINLKNKLLPLLINQQLQ